RGERGRTGESREEEPFHASFLGRRSSWSLLIPPRAVASVAATRIFRPTDRWLAGSATMKERSPAKRPV
ncbi:hypothetical protein E2320_022065, partial [Naja naja]